ncbi:hypothetical protein [Paucibacter sp. KCTC 42545]|uniref:hypothetical protein n=1 Tax=Paucibacter sp. KCTC 42545 TaxID=1768242 RepID=UPI0012E3DA3B|nr:hypothetical protein [Paucibacter sp. KCTC 42545]
METPVDQNDTARLAPTALRAALVELAQSASTSYSVILPPEVLESALRSGVVPEDFAPHIGTLLKDAPRPTLAWVGAQIIAEAGLPYGRTWSNMRKLASKLKIARDISVPAMLMEVQAKDEADVAAGRRSARSLWAVQSGDLDGYTFTPNPNSEFDKPGEDW